MKAKNIVPSVNTPILDLVEGTPRPYAFDEMDKRILQFLAHDSREAFLTIATKLGVDEKTVRYRVGKMRAAGVLIFQPSLNPNLLESCVIISLGLRISGEGKKNLEQIAEQISALPKVIWCGTVLGAFDILAEVALERFEDVRTFQLTGLKDIPHIESVETFAILSHHGRRGVPISPLL